MVIGTARLMSVYSRDVREQDSALKKSALLPATNQFSSMNLSHKYREEPLGSRFTFRMETESPKCLFASCSSPDIGSL